MNVGFVGLGKLGFPVATAMASRGITVHGVDPWSNGPPDTSGERGMADAMEAAGNRLHHVDLEAAVANCTVVFVAVQTPHESWFEGVTPLSDDRSDFDYTALKTAVADIADQAATQDKHLTISVISTVLPGTMRREIVPLLGSRCTLVYNPSFIGMSTVIRDFLDPEFVLLGGDHDGTVENVYRRVYGALDRPRHVRTSIENAELIKVAYNTFIGLKIAFANTLMEVCHKTGCDIDEVTGALKQAHRRLISPAYLDGGMGDGGGCHPRDNIALSWLARELDLSYDLFGAAMEARERQARWLGDLLLEHADGLPLAILGSEFKPGVDSETGSAAVLCANLLRRRSHDVVCFRRVAPPPARPMAYLIGCRHPGYERLRFPAGSVVIDPFRYIPDQDGVTVIRVAEGGKAAVWAPARIAA